MNGHVTVITAANSETPSSNQRARMLRSSMRPFGTLENLGQQLYIYKLWHHRFNMSRGRHSEGCKRKGGGGPITWPPNMW